MNMYSFSRFRQLNLYPGALYVRQIRWMFTSLSSLRFLASSFITICFALIFLALVVDYLLTMTVNSKLEPDSEARLELVRCLQK